MTDNQNNNKAQEPKEYLAVNFKQPAVMGYGYVKSDGTLDNTKIFEPYTFIVTKPSTGAYKINHNFGNTNYVVVTNAVTTGVVRLSYIYEYTNDYFSVATVNGSGTVSDSDFTFVVYKSI